MTWDGRKSGQPLPVEFHNPFVEHLLTGRHKNLVDLPGFGGSAGKAIVFADQYAGANMGAKIQAAITDLGATGGLVLVPPGSHSGTATVTVTSNIDIEFLPGATYSANGDWPAFTIDTGASKIRLIRLDTTGSNNAAHNNNHGAYINSTCKEIQILYGRFYQHETAIKCASIYMGEILVHGCRALDCTFMGFSISAAGGATYKFGYRISDSVVEQTAYGFYTQGQGSIVNCYAYGCTSRGFAPLDLVAIVGCIAEACGMGYIFAYGLSQQSVGYCIALNCTGVGFYLYGAGGGVWANGTCVGCTAINCAGGGFVTDDTAALNLSITLKGNKTVCTTTQPYAFKAYRALKKLVMVGNDWSGFSTAAEYWHADLDKSDFEIAHNQLG